ncbi:MAG: aminopeptidase P family protein [Erysipelotrichaceae bacterium]|nr:aminopeptidase P family protein [Erysipelotrichaceae bacterium]
MNKERISKVLNNGNGMDALLLSDPYAINYLLGKMISPGERFLGLLLQKEKEPILFLNSLFPFEKMEGLTVVNYSDSDDLVEVLRPYFNPEWIMGVDKILPARFLLPIIKNNLVKNCVVGSIAVDKARAVKDEKEKELMRKASKINDEAMAIFKTLVKDGISEKEVATQIPDIYKKLGADNFSFDMIVAFGKNAADPHHMPDDTVVKEGDAVLFDVGCIYKGYCSDMTRTFFYKKGPDEAQKNIYDLVRRANEEAEKIIRPGVRLCDIDKTARDIITEGGYGPYFTHRLGHFIGTEVHEYGDVSSSFKDLTQEGNTFSIEPGIYYPEILGCRIEDLVLVTPDGVEVLNNYPKDIEVIGL